jgi:transcriptional regulator with XRE-family HTH domain
MGKDQVSFIHLSDFRRANGLVQQDIADYLGVTGGYISMVETGISKLSKSNIDRLFASAGEKHWDTAELVPAHTRLLKVFGYYNGLEIKNSGNSAQLLSVNDTIAEKIKYGEIGISEALADSLIRICPELNRSWLLTGEGEMIGGEKAVSESDLTILKRDVESIKNMIVTHEELSLLLENMANKILSAIKGK